MHVRRDDFVCLYPGTQGSAEELDGMGEERLEKGVVLFIATDEEEQFFEIFSKSHCNMFFDDFPYLLPDTNPHLYPIIDVLVISRSLHFIQTYLSTCSGYINSLRVYQK